LGYVPKDPKRAERLKAAEAKILKKRKTGWTPKEEDKIKHGFSGYTNQKCRCPICTKAARDYEKEYTKRIKGQGKPIRGRNRPKSWEK
jgi:hypothetical protein